MSILLKNAKIYDGTGSAPYTADILTEGDRIARIAEGIDAPADAARIPLPADESGLLAEEVEAVELQVKYAGYIARQERQVEEFRRAEERRLPEDLDYAAIAGLRLEARQKLADARPRNVGQAGRISGVSPADVAVLLIYLQQRENGHVL